jgi:hypothetical protein
MMMPKSLDTLVEDIFELFNPEHTHVPDEQRLEEVGEQFKELLRRRLAEREPIDNPLRFSSLGKKDRQVWYMAKHFPTEDLTAKTYFKFLYGDVIELLVLFLAKEAGHTVEREQEEINVDGVLGHIDAIIDGVVVDVKSASPYSYKKFETQTVLENDPFGYVQQLAGYSNVLTPDRGAAWVAFDKVHGDICVSPLSSSIVADYQPAPRIEHLREVIAQDEPPPRCYDDEPMGKSGNRKLTTPCSYCGYKWRCWPNLRGFAYSNGPVYLTEVGKVPDVPEFGPKEVVTNEPRD